MTSSSVTSATRVDLLNIPADGLGWTVDIEPTASHQRPKSHLIAPTEEFTNIIQVMLTTFHEHVDQVKHLNNVKQFITQKIQKEINKENCCWLKEKQQHTSNLKTTLLWALKST